METAHLVWRAIFRQLWECARCITMRVTNRSKSAPPAVADFAIAQAGTQVGGTWSGEPEPDTWSVQFVNTVSGIYEQQSIPGNEDTVTSTIAQPIGQSVFARIRRFKSNEPGPWATSNTVVIATP